MHVLSWHRDASPRTPVTSRYGTADVHNVPQLPRTRKKNQPKGPLQSMRRPEDPTTEEDLGGPH